MYNGLFSMLHFSWKDLKLSTSAFYMSIQKFYTEVTAKIVFVLAYPSNSFMKGC